MSKPLILIPGASSIYSIPPVFQIAHLELQNATVYGH